MDSKVVVYFIYLLVIKLLNLKSTFKICKSLFILTVKLRVKKYSLWEYFTFNNSEPVVCALYKKDLKYNGNITNLKNYSKRVHFIQFYDQNRIYIYTTIIIKPGVWKIGMYNSFALLIKFR